MIRRTITMLIIISSLALLGCVTAPQKKAGAGQSVVISAVVVQDNAVEVHLSEPYDLSYEVSKPSDPYTAVVEMFGVGLGEIPGTVVSDKPGISEVKLSEFREPAPGVRVEVLLESPVELVGEYKEGVLLLRVAGEAEAQGEPGPVEAAAEMPGDEPEAYLAATEITGVGFDYEEGYLRLVISGNGSIMPENVFAVENKIIIDVPETEMLAAMPEEVVSPVSAVRYGAYEDKLRIVVDLKREVEFVATSVGNKLLVSFPAEEAEVLEPEEAEAELAAEEDEFKGKLVSLDFQDADVGPIIKLLARDMGGMNVVIHPQVKGTINLDLRDVPWDLALDIILKQSGLEQRTKGNIMRVAPIKVFSAQDKVAELQCEKFDLEYIPAEKMKETIEGLLKNINSSGYVEARLRLNAVTVCEIEKNLELAREKVREWDIPEERQMQVLIEAKIVEVSTDHTKSLGIRWGGTYLKTNAAGDTSSGGFGINAPVTFAGPGEDNAGIAVSAGIIEVGSVSTTAINLSLAALETMGKTRKLANPRILTIEGEQATITQGVQIPMPVITREGIVGTELKDANLKLTVTPTVTEHDIIHLVVSASNDTPVDLGGGEIGINKQSVKTQALVKDGETLVLGGIYTNSESEGETRVPYLNRIPIIGWLFKTKTKSSAPKELLIFITPRIVR